MKERRKCPFCGRFPYIEKINTEFGAVYSVRCSNIDCAVRPCAGGDVNESVYAVIHRWNTRYDVVDQPDTSMRIRTLENAIMGALNAGTIGEAENTLYSAI